MLWHRRNDLSTTTTENYARQIGEFADWLDRRNVRPEDLTSRGKANLVKKFLNGAKGETAPRTRRQYGLEAHVFLTFCAGGLDGDGFDDFKVIPEVPKWCLSKLVEVPRDDAYTITEEQWRQVVGKVAEEDDERDLVLVLLAGTAGLRRDELCRLKWGDLEFDHENRGVLVHVRRGKGDKARRTPTDSETYEALLSWRNYLAKFGVGLDNRDLPVLPVFGQRGKERALDAPVIHAIDKATVTGLFVRLSKALGFRVHCHCLRHRAAHAWHAEGCSILDIKNFLGHADLETTESYLGIAATASLENLARIRAGRTKDDQDERPLKRAA